MEVKSYRVRMGTAQNSFIETWKSNDISLLINLKVDAIDAIEKKCWDV